MKRPQDSQAASQAKRQRQEFVSHEQIQADRRALPIYSARKRLVKEVQKLNNCIVIGETGSGKTTQIPQFLFEANINRNQVIACTQPRRVAAVTVAGRVAQERGVTLGEQVGYCVRFDDSTSEKTRIKYMTDGMLLREAILDPLLKRYGVVILDEAHERTIHTDVLFGVVKEAQQKRKGHGILLPLKIVIMSATMDVDHFSQYFNNAPVLYIEGRQFPVKLMYAKETQSDYIFSSLVTVFQIHKSEPPEHDILVFLTGQEEIESVVQSIKLIGKDVVDAPPLIVFPLYAAMPPSLQLKAFEPTPKGARKVIVSTNIAETSVTIHGIKFVIDAGMVKIKSYNASSGLDILKVERVSQAQAWQRTGRAGREAPGTCYRLFSEVDFKTFHINTIPEIQRCNLASVVLQLLAMGVKDVVGFDFMDKPTPESIKSAMEQLKLLGAIEAGEDQKLTDLGWSMAAYPLDPSLSKVILAASEQNCLEDILTIVSLLSVDSIVYNPHSKREEALATRRKFQSSEGDHITLLNIFRAYKGVNGNKQWCHDNFVNSRNIKLAMEVRKQLKDIAVRQNLTFKSSSQDTAAIRKCLATGFFSNSAELQKEGHYLTLAKRKPVAIHPSSALFQCKPAVVIYTEVVKTTKCYMRGISIIDFEWLKEIAPSYTRTKVGKLVQ